MSFIIDSSEVLFYWLINVVSYKPIIGIPIAMFLFGLAFLIIYYAFKTLFLISEKIVAKCNTFLYIMEKEICRQDLSKNQKI